jgi:3-oxoadipate enol-lactonase
VPYAEVNGTKLYYELKGKGPAVVLIHGWSLNTEMWDPQFDEFSKRHKVLRYDVRGYGKSEVPDQSKPYTHHDDLKALMDRLDIDKAIVIGLSMGGYIAINFALKYPERTTVLIPVDASLEGYKFSRGFMDSELALVKKAKEEGIESAKRFWIDYPFFKPAYRDGQLAGKLKSIIGSYSGWDLVNDDPIIRLSPPASERLDEIVAPTPVIVGELDSPDFHLIADLVSSNVVNAEKCVIMDAGHMSNMEKPEEFNKVVLGFLSRHGLTY